MDEIRWKFIENGIKSLRLKKREISIKQNNDMNKTKDWMSRIFSCGNFLASPHQQWDHQIIVCNIVLQPTLLDWVASG